jgi:hypothetical protein
MTAIGRLLSIPACRDSVSIGGRAFRGCVALSPSFAFPAA